jgi:glycerophosphoryl diester phosphodiesterase
MNTLLVYHRGGGKSLNYPPNCILTIKWAINHGTEAVEYDVVAVKDGDSYKIIVFEPKLLLENNLDIDSLDWEDVQKLDAGNQKYGYCGIATLKELLDVVDQSKVKQQIHIKGRNPKTVRTLISELDSFENIAITSFDISVLKEVKEIVPNSKVGWIVKPNSKSGSEGAQDLTKMVSENPDTLPTYSQDELETIFYKASTNNIDVVILCGPRFKSKSIISYFQEKGFEVGAWGISCNLDIAKKLIEFGIDRFTIDNPEALR